MPLIDVYLHEGVTTPDERRSISDAISLSFDDRTAETKADLFASLVRHLEQDAGVPEQDVAFRVVETARENWWAAGRTVDPTTGYDQRMTSIVE